MFCYANRHTPLVLAVVVVVWVVSPRSRMVAINGGLGLGTTNQACTVHYTAVLLQPCNHLLEIPPLF